MNQTQKMLVSALVVTLFLVVSGAYLFFPYELDTRLGQHILWHIKLPIWLTAVLVGSSLAVSSACLQVILRTPLADPSLLGISSGASLSASLFFAIGGATGLLAVLKSSHPVWPTSALPIVCIMGAGLSSFIIYRLAQKLGNSPYVIILVGIAIATLMGALASWMILFLPPNQLQSLTFWLMGSLHNTTWEILSVALPVLLISLFFLHKKVHTLNLFYLGDMSLTLKGKDPKKETNVILIASAILVGVSVSIAGTVAFIGLVVPHVIRLWIGYDNKLVIPLSGLLGAMILVSCATINQWLFAVQVPLSMLTATIGAPLFIYLLVQGQRFTTSQTEEWR